MKKKISPITFLIILTIYAGIISLYTSYTPKTEAYTNPNSDSLAFNTIPTNAEVKGTSDNSGTCPSCGKNNPCRNSPCACEKCSINSQVPNFYSLRSNGTLKIEFEQRYSCPKPETTPPKDVKVRISKATFPNQVFAGHPNNLIDGKVNKTYPIYAKYEPGATMPKAVINSPPIGDTLTYLFEDAMPPTYLNQRPTGTEPNNYYYIYNGKEFGCYNKNDSGEYYQADTYAFGAQYKLITKEDNGFKIINERTDPGMLIYENNFNIPNSLDPTNNPDRVSKMAAILGRLEQPPETKVTSDGEKLAANPLFNRSSDQDSFTSEEPHDTGPGNSKTLSVPADNYLGCIDECSDEKYSDGSKKPEYYIEGTAHLTDDYKCKKTYNKYGEIQKCTCSKTYPLVLELGAVTGSNYGGDEGFTADHFFDQVLLQESAPNNLEQTHPELIATDIPEGAKSYPYIRDVYIPVPCHLEAIGADASNVNCVFQGSFFQYHSYITTLHSPPVNEIKGVENKTFNSLTEAYNSTMQDVWSAWGDTCEM